ncbi:MAG TPA: hypothetical protein VGD45_20205 [Steroidobacter sp.]|uniref:hypothetical protein n=1 Tax=Steroidobacter sp. TaxID=1978227 RepID=UPI002ED8CF02
MQPKQPYWQRYWYHLLFRDEREAAFKPMGHEGLRQVPNNALATKSLEQWVEWFLEEAVDELDDFRGALQMLVYAEATPGSDAKPVLVRTVGLGRR